MVTIVASKDTIKSVDPKCVLTYRIIDGEHAQGSPALGWLSNVSERDGYFDCEFDLVSPELDKYIPSTASDEAKFGVRDDDVLVSVIIAVPLAHKSGILSTLGAVKVHTFSRCEKDFNKICSDSCGGCSEPSVYTDVKGRKFEIQGKAILEQALRFQASHNVSYERALIEVSRINKED